MLKNLIELSEGLRLIGLKKESGAVGGIIKASSGYDSGRLEKQITYFRRKVGGSPGREYLDKETGERRVRKATLPQPLSILAPYHKGWTEDQAAVYPHLKKEAVEILLSKKVQINWQNPIPEDAQYMYFELSTPDDVPLYKDDVLSEFERIAAEITAEKFPDYFIGSEYLNNSFPELKGVAEQAKTDVVYFEEMAEEYGGSIEHSEDET